MITIFRWVQDGGFGLYCGTCHEGLGAASDDTSFRHMAHVHLLQAHKGESGDVSDVDSLEEAIKNAG